MTEWIAGVQVRGVANIYASYSVPWCRFWTTQACHSASSQMELQGKGRQDEVMWIAEVVYKTLWINGGEECD